MILSTYQEGNKTANVCKQQHEWVVMVYENDNYIETILATSEANAEELAEDYVMGVK
jgi:hypothetical protein